jgi:hypothetical protein
MRDGIEPSRMDPADAERLRRYLSKIAGAAWDTTRLNRKSQHEMGVKTDF